MKKVTSLILVVMMMLVVGCSVNPSKVDKDLAVEFMDKITYVQDKNTGLCYAIVATRKTGHVNSSGIGITLVPCDSVAKYLVNK